MQSEWKTHLFRLKEKCEMRTYFKNNLPAIWRSNIYDASAWNRTRVTSIKGVHSTYRAIQTSCKVRWPVGKDGVVPLTAEATPPPPPLTMSPHLKTQSTDQIIRAVAVQWPRSPRPPTPWLACRMGGGGWGLLGRGCYSRRERGLQIHHKELIAVLRPQCNS